MKTNTETGEIEQVTDRNKGEFFGVSINTVRKLVSSDAGAEELMAYVILARGVNANRTERISTHGATSIANRTGISYRKAESALKWVGEQGLAIKTADNPKATSPKKNHARWHLQDEGLDVFLANSLTDGIGEGKNNPPLMRIYNEVSLCSSGLMADSRLDALMVLLHLYHHQDMQGCGGVDPRSGIYREWKGSAGTSHKHVTEIEGTNAALFEIEGGNDVMFSKFAEEALFYIPDQQKKNERFFDAIRNLKNLGFIYEVIQVWSVDPNGKNGRNAEPLYTLYVNDRHARESEPYLQKEIHNTCFRLEVLDRYSEFSTDDDEFSFLKSGRFRFIAATKAGGHPIGIYRLRFRPKTKDVGMGMNAEKQRVSQWANSLKKLY